MYIYMINLFAILLYTWIFWRLPGNFTLKITGYPFFKKILILRLWHVAAYYTYWLYTYYIYIYIFFFLENFITSFSAARIYRAATRTQFTFNQKFLVLIRSISEWRKVETTLKPYSGFEVVHQPSYYEI